MKRLFSQRSRHSIWRKLWLWLATCEKGIHLNIEKWSLNRANISGNRIGNRNHYRWCDWADEGTSNPHWWWFCDSCGTREFNAENAEIAKADIENLQERILRHDVMAHINTFGEAAPAAKAIIHLGATSCYGKFISCFSNEFYTNHDCHVVVTDNTGTPPWYESASYYPHSCEGKSLLTCVCRVDSNAGRYGHLTAQACKGVV